MAQLKLGKIPDRTPVKMSISISPALNQSLQDYAVLYADAYGRQEPVGELIPAILAAFLDGDRAFAKARDQLGDAQAARHS